MINGKGKSRMTPAEIQELMELKSWTRVDLAHALELKSENTIYRWLSGDPEVPGPARILMRQWLDEARAEAKTKPGKQAAKAS